MQVFCFKRDTREWLSIPQSSYNPISRNAFATILKEQGCSTPFMLVAMEDRRPGSPVQSPPPPPPPSPPPPPATTPKAEESNLAAIGGALVAVGIVLIIVIVVLALRLGGGSHPHQQQPPHVVHLNVVVDKGGGYSPYNNNNKMNPSRGIEQRRRFNGTGNNMSQLFAIAGAELTGTAASSSSKFRSNHANNNKRFS